LDLTQAAPALVKITSFPLKMKITTTTHGVTSPLLHRFLFSIVNPASFRIHQSSILSALPSSRRKQWVHALPFAFVVS
jgi:hypothetical protein